MPPASARLGRPPLGVRLTGYTPKGEIVPAEADLVCRMFQMFHAGESLKSIARTLTNEGVTTRGRKPWHPSTIRTILVNPRYAGRAIYQGKPTGKLGNWEPIVSDDVFDVVQAKLNDPRRVSNREGTDRKHLGSGLFLCGICEAPVSSWSQNRYVCRERHVNRARVPVDNWVRTVIVARLQREDMADLLAPTESNSHRCSPRSSSYRTGWHASRPTTTPTSLTVTGTPQRQNGYALSAPSSSARSPRTVQVPR